jgi:DNA-binding MarR family transcriptional regulator
VRKVQDPQAFIETFRVFRRCVMAVASEMYGDVGMGSTQIRFLKHIARHGRISQADLARATGTDPALTGRALQGLLDRGVIRRERSKADRREYLLDLGPAGGESFAEVERMHAKLAERIVKPLDDRDMKDFERITKRLIGAFGVPGDIEVEAEPRSGAVDRRPATASRRKVTRQKRPAS